MATKIGFNFLSNTFDVVQNLESIDTDLCHTTNPVSDWVIKNLDEDRTIEFEVNTGGTPGIAMIINSADVVQGGRSVDLRPSDTVWLSNFIFMQQSLELVNTESGIASAIRFKLNNESPTSPIRLFAVETDDPNFGNFSLQLGNTFSPFDHTLLFAGAGIDVKFTTPSLAERFKFEAGINILGGTFAYPGTPFDILSIGGTITDMNDAAAINNVINLATTFEYTVPLNNIFGQTNALSNAITVEPSGLGGGVDTHSVRGQAATAFFENGGARTMLTLQGAFFQSGVRTSGTVTTATGVTAQAGTVLGGTITNAISILAGAPFMFLGGNVVNGVSLRVIGGLAGSTSNWALQVQNSAVSSYMEGNFVIGQNTATASAFRLFLNGNQKIASNFGLFFGGTLNADATFFIQDAGSNLIQFGSVGNQTNNSRLVFDFETTANIVNVSGTSSDLTPGIIWDLASTRINGNFGFNIAPTAVQTGYTTMSNLNTLRTGNRNTLSLKQTVDIIGTLIEDLKAKGVISA